jgi:Glycosyl hydrolase family 63 C-terminal domain
MPVFAPRSAGGAAVYTHSLAYTNSVRAAARIGHDVSQQQLIKAAISGLDYLWKYRRLGNGLLYIVHPWESGADHSPRWDSWMAPEDRQILAYDRGKWTERDGDLVDAALYSEEGDARWSKEFVVAPAAFNAVAAYAAAELYGLTHEEKWLKRSIELGDVMDQVLWDEGTRLFADRPVVGGGLSAFVPTLDGVVGALATNSASKARMVLDQVEDPERFYARYGLRYLPIDHERYQPDKYWRGPAWPQLNYLVFLACYKWDRRKLASRVARMTRRGVRRANFAEFWNPETGQALAPGQQTWSALVAAMNRHHPAKARRHGRGYE